MSEIRYELTDKGRAMLAKVGKSKAASFDWSHVRRGDPSECWPWLGGLNTWGYGACQVGGIAMNASRAAYISAHGEPAAGLVVCHSCDNPICCNPTHLRADSQANNLAECRAKGRQVYRTGASHHRATAKLTEELVREARHRFAGGESQSSIARDLGLSSGTVSRAVRGETWAHVK